MSVVILSVSTASAEDTVRPFHALSTMLCDVEPGFEVPDGVHYPVTSLELYGAFVTMPPGDVVNVPGVALVSFLDSHPIVQTANLVVNRNADGPFAFFGVIERVEILSAVMKRTELAFLDSDPTERRATHHYESFDGTLVDVPWVCHVTPNVYFR